MTPSPMRLAVIVCAGLTAAAPCCADSFTASSASSAGSASVGSISGSLRGSSNSSSPDNDVAEGEYRILDIARPADRPGTLRLTLQPAARAPGEGTVWLDLPPQALARRGLVAGDTVNARKRAYGYEFSHADTREPFFLVLADDWHDDLGSRRVAY